VVHAPIVARIGGLRSSTLARVPDFSASEHDRTVDHWFASRTSAVDDWPLERVRELKRGRRVAVILPALDEESTVGDIVTSIRADLARAPGDLVDEVIVADSGSTRQRRWRRRAELGWSP
jgi:hypothetical protein